MKLKSDMNKDDAIKALAVDISGRFPVSIKAIYDALKNIIQSLETAMELSIATGHDASVLLEYARHQITAQVIAKLSVASKDAITKDADAE